MAQALTALTLNAHLWRAEKYASENTPNINETAVLAGLTTTSEKQLFFRRSGFPSDEPLRIRRCAVSVRDIVSAVL